jgi:hypothetical protein
MSGPNRCAKRNIFLPRTVRIYGRAWQTQGCGFTFLRTSAPSSGRLVAIALKFCSFKGDPQPSRPGCNRHSPERRTGTRRSPARLSATLPEFRFGPSGCRPFGPSFHARASRFPSSTLLIFWRSFAPRCIPLCLSAYIPRGFSFLNLGLSASFLYFFALVSSMLFIQRYKRKLSNCFVDPISLI